MEFDELRVSAENEGGFGLVLGESPVCVGGERLSVYGQDVHLRRRRSGGGGEERMKEAEGGGERRITLVIDFVSVP